MKKFPFVKISAILFLTSFCGQVQAHDHMPAAATSSSPGATLEYYPFATDFTTNSGFVFNLTAGTSDDPYHGYYYTSDQVFTALAATPTTTKFPPALT